MRRTECKIRPATYRHASCTVAGCQFVRTVYRSCSSANRRPLLAPTSAGRSARHSRMRTQRRREVVAQHCRRVARQTLPNATHRDAGATGDARRRTQCRCARRRHANAATNALRRARARALRIAHATTHANCRATRRRRRRQRCLLCRRQRRNVAIVLLRKPQQAGQRVEVHTAQASEEFVFKGHIGHGRWIGQWRRRRAHRVERCRLHRRRVNVAKVQQQYIAGHKHARVGVRPRERHGRVAQHRTAWIRRPRDFTIARHTLGVVHSTRSAQLNFSFHTHERRNAHKVHDTSHKTTRSRTKEQKPAPNTHFAIRRKTQATSTHNHSVRSLCIGCAAIDGAGFASVRALLL
jgi:hypothetical protein